MMNINTIVLPLLVGFVVPSLLCSALRPLVGEAWPRHSLEHPAMRQPLAFVLALLCGPALLVEQLANVADKRRYIMDFALGCFACAGWSGLYGYVLLYLVQLAASHGAQAV